MKIITLNILHGGGERIESLLNFFEENSCDVAVLSEYRENKNSKKIRDFFYFQGLCYQISNAMEPRQNSVFVASKHPFIPNIGKNNLKYNRRIVDLKFKKFDLVGVYFPIKKKKSPVFEELINLLSSKNNSTICMGDFNTGKHYLDEKGASFIGSDYLNQIEAVGIIDAWRHIHKSKKEFSWYSPKGNGFRLDHTFISESMKNTIEYCTYIHSPREEKITDHSAMILKLRN